MFINAHVFTGLIVSILLMMLMELTKITRTSYIMFFITIPFE